MPKSSLWINGIIRNDELEHGNVINDDKVVVTLIRYVINELEDNNYET